MALKTLVGLGVVRRLWFDAALAVALHARSTGFRVTVCIVIWSWLGGAFTCSDDQQNNDRSHECQKKGIAPAWFPAFILFVIVRVVFLSCHPRLTSPFRTSLRGIPF